MKTFKSMTPEQQTFMFVVVLVCTALFGVFTGLLGQMTGFDRGTEAMKREAVRKGHASYTADDEGNPKWSWKKE